MVNGTGGGGAGVRVVLIGTGVLAIPPTGYGGVERTIAELAAALRAAGHEAVVLNEVRRGRSIDEYWFARGLPGRVRGVRGDVVHASTPVVANRLRLAGIPYVYTSHSRHWFERTRWSHRWGFWLEKRAVQGAAATIALTPRLSAAIASAVGPATTRRMTTVPIGVDLERFVPDWSRRTGRKALGVGVVAPMKRWELAAAALRGTGVGLTILGPQPDPAYAQKVRQAGDLVELLGEVGNDELRRRLAESDWLVHPSRVELLSGAVLQGLAAGLPVLGAAPVGELVETGVDGWCSAEGASEPEIVASTRSHAVELARNAELRRRMGDAARRNAEARFSWRSVAAAHVGLYQSVIAETTRR